MRWIIPLLLGYNGIIAYFSLISTAEVARYPGGWLILLSGGFYIHLAAYMVLTFIWGIYGLERYRCMLASFATGAFWETAQFMVPDRYASLSDIAANLIGASIGYILLKLGFAARVSHYKSYLLKIFKEDFKKSRSEKMSN